LPAFHLKSQKPWATVWLPMSRSGNAIRNNLIGV
jgi:hypothetical protein